MRRVEVAGCGVDFLEEHQKKSYNFTTLYLDDERSDSYKNLTILTRSLSALKRTNFYSYSPSGGQSGMNPLTSRNEPFA